MPVASNNYQADRVLYATATARLVAPPVNVAQASVVIAPANVDRVGWVIYNNGANSVYIVLGSTATSVLCAKILATFATWECYGPAVYTGALSAIRNAGSGAVNVYELIRTA